MASAREGVGKPSGLTPANRPLVTVAPEEEPPVVIPREDERGVMTRRYFNLTGIDLNDDEAIDRWAEQAASAFLEAIALDAIMRSLKGEPSTDGYEVERTDLARDLGDVPGDIAAPLWERSYGEWSVRASRAILDRLPKVRAELIRCRRAWTLHLFEDAGSCVTFRSDGTWVEDGSRSGEWRLVKEGGPEEVGRSIARRYGPNRRTS